MRRRALLAGLGAVAAGCTTGYEPAGDSERTRGDTPTGAPANASNLRNCATPTPADAPGDPPSDAEYRLSDLSVEATTDGPEHRFVLEPTAFYSQEAVEREAEESGEEQVVRRLSEVEPPAVRDAIRTALDEGAWRADQLPEGLADTVDTVDFFTHDGATGTHTHVGLTLHRLHPDRPPAVVPEVRVVDPHVAPGDPGEIEFALRNRASEPREVFSGTVPPFGMLHAEAVRGSERFLLWVDYEEEGCYVRTDEGWAVCSIGKITRLQPCERVSRRYAVLPSTTDHYPDLTVPRGAGSYRVENAVSHSAEFGGPSTTLSFTTEFDLERL